MNSQQYWSRMISSSNAIRRHVSRSSNITSKRTAKKGRVMVLANSRVVSETPLEGQNNKPGWIKEKYA